MKHLKTNVKAQLKRASIKDKKPTILTSALQQIPGFDANDHKFDTILVEMLIGGEAIKRTFHSSRAKMKNEIKSGKPATYYADKKWDNPETMPNVIRDGGPTNMSIIGIEYDLEN